MLNIGCHLSSSNGLLSMSYISYSIGGNTFQFFLRNPKSGKSIQISDEDIKLFLEFSKKNKFSKIVAHSPYTINLCSSKSNVREFSRKMLKSDIEKMERIPENIYNLHPGSHTGLGISKGIEFISEALSDILSNKCKTTTIVLETMSGKGTEVGSTFDELSSIIKNSNSSSNLGVCFDTCHMFDAGFDFDKIDLILEEFDKKIGIDKLKLIHLNDSKNPIGSKKDRHECIGKGFIGMDVFKKIMNHEYLKNLPFILETPNDLIGYAEEIFTLKKMT